MIFFFVTPWFAILGYFSLLFSARVVMPRKPIFTRILGLLGAVLLAPVIAFLVMCVAGRDYAQINWTAYGMVLNMSKAVGEGVYVVPENLPLLGALPLVLGIVLGLVLHLDKPAAGSTAATTETP